MNPFKSLLFIPLALLALIACEKEDDSSSNQELDEYYASHASIGSTSPYFTSTEEGGAIRFKTEGGSVVINVNCGTEWTVANTASDLFTTAINSTSGSLTVSASQNMVEQELSGTITLMTANSLITFATLSVTQNAYGAPEIKVEPTEWQFPAVGDLSKDIAVESSVGTFDIESPAEWLTVVKTADGITVTAEENLVGEDRQSQITLTVSDGIKSDFEVISISQEAHAYIALSRETVTFYNAGTAEVSVEANCEWDYSYDTNDWFKIAREDDVLTVTVTAENEDGGRREGVVALSGSIGEENVAEAQLSIVQYGGGEAMVITYTTTTSQTKVTLPLAGTVDCTVDWGDGGDEETVTSEFPTHTYSTAGEYDVTISGTVTALSHESLTTRQNPNTTITAVKQWGTTGLNNMSFAFSYCEALSSIPTDTAGSFADVTDFSYAFSYCEQLEVVPAGIFDNCENVTAFEGTFNTCEKLTVVPEGLFAHCPKVDSFLGVFEWCVILEAIPSDLFAYCPLATDFGYAFYKCEKLKEIPSGLFDNCPEVLYFDKTFYMCYDLEVIPEGLFKNCTKVLWFEGTFWWCDSVKAIPADIFATCTQATDFQYVFQYLQSITEIPRGLFKNCVSAKNFKSAFYGCENVTEIPEDLFSNCPYAEDLSWIFAFCFGLQSIPENLFANNTMATTFERTFNYCSGLTSIPENLFANNTEVTSFVGTFEWCLGFTGLPENLFKNNTKVTDFSRIFYCNENLKTVPEGMFANNPLVTSFYQAFSFDYELGSVPENLFAKNPEVTNFGEAFRICTSLTSIPPGLFANNLKVTSFDITFLDCNGLTGESPYNVVNIDGEERHVHLYERSLYTTELGCVGATGTQCYKSCTGLSDYDQISSFGWN